MKKKHKPFWKMTPQELMDHPFSWYFCLFFITGMNIWLLVDDEFAERGDWVMVVMVATLTLFIWLVELLRWILPDRQSNQINQKSAQEDISPLPRNPEELIPANRKELIGLVRQVLPDKNWILFQHGTLLMVDPETEISHEDLLSQWKEWCWIYEQMNTLQEGGSAGLLKDQLGWFAISELNNTFTIILPSELPLNSVPVRATILSILKREADLMSSEIICKHQAESNSSKNSL